MPKQTDACRLADGYLLGEPVSKPAVIAALLAARSQTPAAAPFYRAFEAIGVKAADEALVALRLVLAGQTPSDAKVAALRTLTRIARCAGMADRDGVSRAIEDHSALADRPREDNTNPTEAPTPPGWRTGWPDLRAGVASGEPVDFSHIRELAKRAYFAELGR